MKSYIWLILLFNFNFVSAQTTIEPTTRFYRLDQRPPEEVFGSGFLAWGTNRSAYAHVAGLSCNNRDSSSGMSSAYISVSSDINASDRWFNNIQRLSAVPFWRYNIRPNTNFYSATRSIEAASLVNIPALRPLRNVAALYSEYLVANEIPASLIESAELLSIRYDGMVSVLETRTNPNYVNNRSAVNTGVLAAALWSPSHTNLGNSATSMLISALRLVISSGANTFGACWCAGSKRRDIGKRSVSDTTTATICSKNLTWIKMSQ